MIMYGSCYGDDGSRYREFTLPSLDRIMLEEDRRYSRPSVGGIATIYNQYIELARNNEDCEALVLLHDDVEIVDRNFRSKIQSAVQEQHVGIVGVIGASGLTSLAWWVGRHLAGSVFETRGYFDNGNAYDDVDSVDGLLLVLSRAAFEQLNFDEESFPKFHGYDVDICLSARESGFRVIVRPIEVLHRTKGGFGDSEAFDKANRVIVNKWPERIRPYSTSERAARQVRSRVGQTRHRLYQLKLRLERLRSRSNSARVGKTGVTSRPESIDGAFPLNCPICKLQLGVDHEAAALPVIIECPECGIGVTDPPPQRDVEGDGIWIERYGAARLARRDLWFEEARQRVGWVSLYVPAGDLIELGSGTGEFVATAESFGFHALGIEPSLWAAEAARAIGANTFRGILSEWVKANPSMTIDAVCMWHVLEHIENPIEILEEVMGVLVPGGIFALEVPNFGSTEAKRLGIEWDASQPSDHFYHYTNDSIGRLLALAGFEIVELLPMTRRPYIGREAWLRERNEALLNGRAWPPLDLLRAVARKPMGI